MRGKIAVIGPDEGSMAAGLSSDGRVDVVTADPAGFADAAGADVVVLLEGADVAAAAAQAARRAPAAVVLVATADAEGDTARALGASLLPRTRVVGVLAEDVARAADAVLHGGEATLQAAVLCRGELGIEGRVATVPATIGAGGLTSVGGPQGG